MVESDLKTKVCIWAKKIGPKKAWLRLVNRGVSHSAADKLTRGRYESTPGELLAAVLLEEMSKDADPGEQAS